ncbi:DUF2530 domain-containing protein [Agromyces archimandritae]|uniref:DUF2530 domain-containing protein n=1 Tax=Agromyces archimandritae TaxID=2781962 RepID=A0A975FL90_9MICO|nr:DUF2530 domain-containing protein [Agromyces archimandritae]QTX04004.1 DUF2530 domain-containing protein [Agromyces archimandritae]
MRFWLSEQERRPDPEPVRADARKAVVAGTVLWLLAMLACWIWREPLAEAGLGWWFTTSALGVALGVGGFAVVQWRRREEIARTAEAAAAAEARDEPDPDAG